MSVGAALSLNAVETVDMQALVSSLKRRLNRRNDPPVSVTVVRDLVCFRADTWQPILLARVEDALDELIGTPWRCGFTLTTRDVSPDPRAGHRSKDIAVGRLQHQ